LCKPDKLCHAQLGRARPAVTREVAVRLLKWRRIEASPAAPAAEAMARRLPITEAMTVEEMIKQYKTALYARAMRLVRTPADAWDLVQDTFEHALRAYARLQPDSNLRVWLMTIMHHLFIDRCRRKAREPSAMMIEEDQIPSPEPYTAPAWASVSEEAVAAAVADLESPFREVYQLRLIDKCSYEEIAERLLIPRSTVGTRLMRARQKLRQTLLEQQAAVC
jgi:RNA polymerase sigma-70 factor (ECF subfamily)